MSSPQISFVVIAFNEDHHIENCLESIESLDGLEDYEIFVVDDGSTDRTASIVEEYRLTHPRVTLISQVNQGRGGARACGLAATSGAMVAMVDGDLELPRNWLERCQPELKSVDVVGGVAVPEGDVTWLHSTFRLDPRPSPIDVGVTGNNGLYRREAIVAIGFDPEMRTAEDIVFRHKLEDAGFSSKCLGDLLCLHQEDKGYLRTLSWMIESGISATHQLRRFRPWRFADFAVVGWMTATIVAFAFGGPLLGFAITLSWILLVGSAHVLRRFRFELSPWYFVRFTSACVVNISIIGCYFVGRVLGVLLPNRIPRWK